MPWDPVQVVFFNWDYTLLNKLRMLSVYSALSLITLLSQKFFVYRCAGVGFFDLVVSIVFALFFLPHFSCIRIIPSTSLTAPTNVTELSPIDLWLRPAEVAISFRLGLNSHDAPLWSTKNNLTEIIPEPSDCFARPALAAINFKLKRLFLVQVTKVPLKIFHIQILLTFLKFHLYLSLLAPNIFSSRYTFRAYFFPKLNELSSMTKDAQYNCNFMIIKTFRLSCATVFSNRRQWS